MENLLVILSVFILYLLVQSLVINGIFISAKGSEGTLPDGSIEKSEMIFYPIYRFLNQYTVKKMYFTLSVIKSLVGSNWPEVPGALIKWNDTYSDRFAITLTGITAFNLDSLKKWAEMYLGAKIFYDAEENTISFYQNVTFYRFSKYLRKPIITCVICMASFWSIFLFLTPAICIFGFSVKIILIWVVDVFCVSYLNFLIFKPRK